MAELSSNWKKLRGKVKGKKSSGKVGKKVEKTTAIKTDQTTKKNVHKKVELINIDLKNTVKPEVETEAPVTKLAQTLWSNDQDISLDTAGGDAKLTPKKMLPGKYLAIDCEFVGVGPEGEESALARVSIVNFYGYTIYDKFVRPRETVTDWRTWVSGVTPKHMKDAITFKEAQKDTADLFKNKIIVGHAIHHDLDALFLTHPKSQIRDTTTFKPFREISNGKTPGLKKLTSHFLKIDIQDGQHSSVEDARATMLLFRLHKKEFEKGIRGRKEDA